MSGLVDATADDIVCCGIVMVLNIGTRETEEVCLRSCLGEAKTLHLLSSEHLLHFVNHNPHSSLLFIEIDKTETMAAVCHRCALRLQRIAQADAAVFRKRTFSSTSTLHRLPTFADSSNPELNEALTQLRDKHLVPAYLGKQQRKLIFGQKYKQFLQDNPQTAYPGGQEVELRWIDRKRDIPKRRPLVSKALHLIMDSESNDWQNLPLVLEGMKEGVKKPLREQDLEMLVRKALQRGKLGVIIQCLQQSEKTGMSLEQEYVLRSVVYGLREMAFRSGWDRATTAKALRDANVISLLLESEEHGSGRKLKPDDPRVRPEILGVFLELAAVYAKKHSESKDGQGLVKAYAGRLVSSLAARNAEVGLD